MWVLEMRTEKNQVIQANIRKLVLIVGYSVRAALACGLF